MRSLFLILFLAATPVFAQTSFYNIGNSFSDHIVGTPNIGASMGHSFDWGRHMIPGASLSFIYQNPDSGFSDQGYYDEALRFHRAQAGLDYTIQSSGNLSNWNTHSLNPGSPGTEVTVPIGIGSAPHFYRLVITKL